MVSNFPLLMKSKDISDHVGRLGLFAKTLNISKNEKQRSEKVWEIWMLKHFDL